MLYKEPEALRDDTNNDCAGHYNRNTLLSIILQLRYPGGPLNSLLGGLSDVLKDKHWTNERTNERTNEWMNNFIYRGWNITVKNQ